MSSIFYAVISAERNTPFSTPVTFYTEKNWWWGSMEGKRGWRGRESKKQCEKSNRKAEWRKIGVWKRLE